MDTQAIEEIHPAHKPEVDWSQVEFGALVDHVDGAWRGLRFLEYNNGRVWLYEPGQCFAASYEAEYCQLSEDA